MGQNVKVEQISAGDLIQGDTILNVGSVQAVGRVGVFVVASVLTRRASLATGKIDLVTTDYVRHETDEVFLSL